MADTDLNKNMSGEGGNTFLGKTRRAWSGDLPAAASSVPSLAQQERGPPCWAGLWVEMGTQRWSPNPDQCSPPSSPSFVFVLSQILNPREDRKDFSFLASPGESSVPFVPLGLKLGKWERWEKGKPLRRGETI